MTCFRMKNGMSLLMACRAANLCYINCYHRVDKGMQPEEAFWDALRNKGNRRSHAKYFYKGEPLSVVVKHNIRIYQRIIRRLKRGIPLEKAVESVLSK